MTNLTKVPRHVAVIMDGNGRWAKRRSRPRVFGHKSGATRVKELVESAAEVGIQYLTLYAFSEENWKRPVEEVSALFSLLTSYLRQEVKKLHSNNVRLRAIGNRHKLPQECQRLLNDGEALTADNTGLQLVLALSYSGRSDIVQAAQMLARLVEKKSITPDQIDDRMVSDCLSTHDIPDPDLMIRTSGEQRLSNFLLWEMAYTEFYFTDKHWPEFTKADLMEALTEYAKRQRRYGLVDSESAEHELGFDKTFSNNFIETGL